MEERKLFVFFPSPILLQIMSFGKTISVDESPTGVFTVRINCPKKLNAIDIPTLDELNTVFSEYLLSQIDRVRVVILTGSGDRAFSSGLDLTSESVGGIFTSSSASPGARAVELKALIIRMQRPIIAIANFPRPVIAAVNGLCVGLGVDLATACDIRVCSPAAKFAVREIKIGICADLGSLFFLPRICKSDSWVREVCYTGRFFGAAEALEQGFVSQVGDGFEMAMKLAEEIAGNPPVAVEGIKVNLNNSTRDRMRENFEFVAVWNSVKLQDTEIISECVTKVLASSRDSKL
jgi:Delta3,5-Delta2,4-dienoyl-CoA isomerase